jgi:hypothetical protein
MPPCVDIYVWDPYGRGLLYLEGIWNSNMDRVIGDMFIGINPGTFTWRMWQCCWKGTNELLVY